MTSLKVRRVVNGHDARGKAIVAIDDVLLREHGGALHQALLRRRLLAQRGAAGQRVGGQMDRGPDLVVGTAAAEVIAHF